MSGMKTVISCGAAIVSNGKVLLCHATKPGGAFSWWDKSWGVPKGMFEDDADHLECAIRETREESGLALPKDKFWENGGVFFENKYKSSFEGEKVNKILKVFLFIDESGELETEKNFCSTLMPEFDNLPEVDRYLWIEPEHASPFVFRSQEEAMTKIYVDILGNG
jgi:predicted NUDIX family NTP pyrophosphohydrolase